MFIFTLPTDLDYVYTGPVPNGSGPKIGSDRPSVYMDPSGTSPEWIQNWTC